MLSCSTLLIVSGCMTVWNTTVGPQQARRLGLTAVLPAGWARFNPDRDLLMTRDGFLLQSIHVTRARYGSELPHTERTLTPGIEPQEAAQILLDSLGADLARHQLAVLENRPETIAGQPGFRCEVKFRTEEKLTMREAYSVVMEPESYIIVRYAAPERHYFENTRADYEAVLASLQIVGPPPPLEKPKRR